MSRALALVLALCALVAPSVAQAQGRLNARVPARASGPVEASGGSRVGSRDFLQRDPEGFVDSVNVYAAMANDPVNNRDPTGRLRVSSAFVSTFPRSTEIIKDILSSVLLSDLRTDILNAYRSYAGAEEEDVRDALTWQQGPSVESGDAGMVRRAVVDGDSFEVWVPACGQYDQDNQPDTLTIDTSVLWAYEQGEIDAQQLVVTILHELAHYLDQRRPMMKQWPGEVGDAFERSAFGRMTPCLPRPRPIQKMSDRIRTPRHPRPTLPLPFP